MSVLWKSSESLPSGYQDKLLEKIRNCFLFSNLLHQNCSVPFSRSVISDSVAPRAAAHQASLSITNSWSLLIQISQEIGQVVWYSHLLNFAQFVVMHTVKGFGTVNKAELDFFWNSLDFSMTQQIGNLIFVDNHIISVIIVHIPFYSRLNNGPQRCQHPNPQNMLICYKKKF